MRVGIVYPAPLYRDGAEYTSDSPTFKSIARWSAGFEGVDLVAFVGDGRRRRGHFRVELDGIRILELPFPTSRLQQHVLLMPAMLRAMHRILSENRSRWGAVILFDLIFPNWVAYEMCRALDVPVALRMVGRYDLFVRESLRHEGPAKALAGFAYGSVIRQVAARAARTGAVVTDGNVDFAAPEVRPSIGFCVESHLDGATIPRANPYPAPPADGPLRVLSVSRIHPAKGVHLLVDAVRSLVESGARVELDIVGPHNGDRYGNYRAFLEERIGAAPSGAIRYHGMVSEGPEFDALWERAGVFVVPYTSNADGVPRVIFEAMTRGIPIVSTAIGGIPEVIQDGQCGLLVPPGDATRLAGAIRRVLEDPALRVALSRQAFRAARLYTSESVAAQLPRMLEDAARRSSRTHHSTR